METFIQILATVAAVVALVGAIINLYKDKPWWRWCFRLWLLSNAAAVFINMERGVWAYVVEHLIYMAIVIIGIWMHRRKK